MDIHRIIRSQGTLREINDVSLPEQITSVSSDVYLPRSKQDTVKETSATCCSDITTSLSREAFFKMQLKSLKHNPIPLSITEREIRHTNVKAPVILPSRHHGSGLARYFF